MTSGNALPTGRLNAGDVEGLVLGEDGMRLHDWAIGDPSVAERVFGNMVEETGAMIMGRRTYDNSIKAWAGKGPLGEVPCFVVTHKPPASSDPVFRFVTDGIERALASQTDGVTHLAYRVVR